jgi:hypothetical protein
MEEEIGFLKKGGAERLVGMLRSEFEDIPRRGTALMQLLRDEEILSRLDEALACCRTLALGAQAEQSRFIVAFLVAREQHRVQVPRGAKLGVPAAAWIGIRWPKLPAPQPQ